MGVFVDVTKESLLFTEVPFFTWIYYSLTNAK